MKTSSKRPDQRAPDQLRRVRIQKNVVRYADGSVLIEMGNTKVLCAATLEEAVPRWMREQKKEGGWVSAEYAMAPYASSARKGREGRKTTDGRSTEIQRLVGRSLRAVVDMKKMGARTLWLDCDVLQADGGTRTASITGAYVALVLAFKKLQKKNLLAELPLKHAVAAVSVGLFHGQPIVDLCYEEDSQADADLNIVMTDDNRFIEINGGSEAEPIAQEQIDALLTLARQGIAQLIAVQKKVLQ